MCVETTLESMASSKASSASRPSSAKVPAPKLKEFVFTDKLGSGSYATVYKAYRKVCLFYPLFIEPCRRVLLFCITSLYCFTRYFLKLLLYRIGLVFSSNDKMMNGISHMAIHQTCLFYNFFDSHVLNRIDLLFIALWQGTSYVSLSPETFTLIRIGY